MPSGNDAEKIVLPYGDRQTFRYRCEDINILGATSLALPVRRSQWRLNNGLPVHFYVERKTTEEDPPRYPWNTRTPAVNRLRDRPGTFNIEIPNASPQLRPGDNHVAIVMEDADGEQAHRDAEFTWDPEPVALPLDLSDLKDAGSIQEIGQVVDGLWDLDRSGNTITTRGPVANDALLLLGAPHASQEATYNVVFSAPLSGAFVGLSDFFVRHDEQQPNLGIKPGYSTAGLATLKPRGLAQCWAAMADNTWDKDWSWVRKSDPARVSVEADVVFAVRHQVIFDGATILSRFRIWPAAEPEPRRWLAVVDTAALSTELPRPAAATFGLFQHRGIPTRWSNIQVRALQGKISADDLAARHTLIEGWRRIRYEVGRLASRAKKRAP